MISTTASPTHTIRLARSRLVLLLGLAVCAGLLVLALMFSIVFGAADIAPTDVWAAIVVVKDVPAGLIPTAAFAGALLVAGLIYVLAWNQGDSPIRLILVGIGLSAIVGAATQLIITFGNVYDVQRALIWLTGSVYGRSWAEFWPLLPWVAVFAPLALLLARDLNTLNLRVVHDLNHATRHAHHLIALRDERLVAAGPPAEIVTPALLRQVFGVEAEVLPDPRTGMPLCVAYGLTSDGTHMAEPLASLQLSLGETYVHEHS